MIILGLHGGVTINQHEPAAALIVDGKVLALCEEERYTRIKSSYGYLPERSIYACLELGGIRFEDIDLVVTPGLTYDDFGSRWESYLRHLFGFCPKIEQVHHQVAHVATSFYGSDFDEAICISLDSSGDGLSGVVAIASRSNGIRVIEEFSHQNSLGRFYTLMTFYCGFSDGDEYKLMGLAPYGKPNIDLSKIIDLTSDGWYFDQSYVRSNPIPRSPFEPQYSESLIKLLRKGPRKPNQDFDDYYRNVAASTQFAIEKCLVNLVNLVRNKYPSIKNLCYSGGVALNCSANRTILELNVFDGFYVSPVASDRGLALGCAYIGSKNSGDHPESLKTIYLGSEYSNDSIKKELQANGLEFEHVDDPSGITSKLLSEEKIVAWHQGRSEAGARALGNRSILASCSDTGMRDKVNKKIKYREEFRPFAPAVLQNKVGEYFYNHSKNSYPHMTITLKAKELNQNNISAVVHVDGTSRVQTVSENDNLKYFNLISSYEKITKVPVIMNTSFNLKGQPIVETPRDALMTFYGCGLDAMVIGNYLIQKPSYSSA